MKPISAIRFFSVLLTLCATFSAARSDEAKSETPMEAHSASEAVTESSAPVGLRCTSQKCWLQIAKLLQTHPNARHISVAYYEFQRSAISGEMLDWEMGRWFFNSRYETVDCRSPEVVGDFWHPRLLYKRVSKRLLLKWMAQNTDWTTQDFRFDDFAKRNGVEKYSEYWDAKGNPAWRREF